MGRVLTSERGAILAWVMCVVVLAAPSSASAATPVSAISAGAGSVYALTSTGGLEAWGWNYYGQLGVGSDTEPDVCGWSETYPIGCAISPTAVSGLGSGVSAVVAGYASTCALTSAGGVWCWGYNAVGALGDGTTTGPEKCGQFPIACSAVPFPVTGLQSGVSAIGAGWEHACALLHAGDMECWGSNDLGTLGDGTTTESSTPVTVQLPVGVKVTAIATGGGYQTCALTTEGGVLCWGSNATGELGDGSYTGPQTCGKGEKPCSTVPVAVELPAGVTATAVSVGSGFSCAVTTTGGVFCWGYNHDGELGDGNTTETTTPVEVQLPAGVTVTAISSKDYDTCVSTSEGGVLCWGQNFGGQLGDGTHEGPEDCIVENDPCSTKPVAVSGLDGAATAVAVGEEYACALMESGGVECWGYDGTGALGDNRRENLTPAPVRELMSTLSVLTSGAGSGTVSSSPAGIDCGGAGHTSCAGLFAPGSTVLLRAKPAAGSGFLGFTGGGCGGSSLTCEVHVSEAQSVMATFALAPSASIAAPADGGTYMVGESAFTRFSCTEGESGPGLASCDDSTGTRRINGGSGRLDTSTPGRHTYTVTATSTDGQTGTASITYIVAASPRVSITAPTSGHIYTVGQSVSTSFTCVEGTEGPGIASCEDSNGTEASSAGSGQLDTSTPGARTYTVTATSKDGAQAMQSIDYDVVPALSVRILSARAFVRHERTKVEMRCAGGVPGGACYGTISLTSRERIRHVGRARRRTSFETIVLARAHYTLASGSTQPLTLRLTKAGRRLLAQIGHPPGRLRAQASATTGGGEQRARRAIVLLRRRAPAKPPTAIAIE